jgi:hypothetical protein
MQNAKCKMQKGLRLLFLHFAFCILHSALANELTVDRTTLNANDEGQTDTDALLRQARPSATRVGC